MEDMVPADGYGYYPDTHALIHDLREKENKLSTAIIFPIVKTTYPHMETQILKHIEREPRTEGRGDSVVHFHKSGEAGPVEAVVYMKDNANCNMIVRLESIDNINRAPSVSIPGDPYTLRTSIGIHITGEILQSKVSWIKVKTNMDAVAFRALIAKLFGCDVHIYVHGQHLANTGNIGQLIKLQDTVHVLIISNLNAVCVMRHSSRVSHQIQITCKNTILIRDLKNKIRSEIASFSDIGENADLILVSNNVLLRDGEMIGFIQMSHGWFVQRLEVKVYIAPTDPVLIHVRFSNQTYLGIANAVEERIPVSRNISTEELRNSVSCIVGVPAVSIKLVMNKKRLREMKCISKEHKKFEDGVCISVFKADHIKLRITTSSSAIQPSFSPQSLYLHVYKLQTLEEMKSLILESLNINCEVPVHAVSIRMNNTFMTNNNLSSYHLRDEVELYASINEDAIIVYVYYCNSCQFRVVIKNKQKAKVDDLLETFSEILKKPHRNLYMFVQHGMAALGSRCSLVEASIANGTTVVLRSHALSAPSTTPVSVIYQCRMDASETTITPRKVVQAEGKFLFLETESQGGLESPGSYRCPVVPNLEKGFIMCDEIMEIYRTSLHHNYATGKPKQGSCAHQLQENVLRDSIVVAREAKPNGCYNGTKTQKSEEQDYKIQTQALSGLSCYMSDSQYYNNDLDSSDYLTPQESLRSDIGIDDPFFPSDQPTTASVENTEVIADIKYRKQIVRERDKTICIEYSRKAVSDDMSSSVSNSFNESMSSLHLERSDETAHSIDKQVINIVSKYVGGNWKVLARNLGFEETEIDDIQHKNKTQSLPEYTRSVLRIWIQKRGSHATRAELRTALIKSHLRQVAEDANLISDE